MSLESELSKLRHPSNSKNFPILGSVPPKSKDPITFPMTKFLAEGLGEYKNWDYADDDIANEVPGYYARVIQILFSDHSYACKMKELNQFGFMANIPAHEMDFFEKIASALSDQKIAEARNGAVDGPKLPASDVNKPTKTGIYTPCAGGNLGIWGTLAKVFKRSHKARTF